MTNALDLGFARTAHRMVRQADDALNLMTRSEQQQPSLTKVIADLLTGHGIQGFNREYLQEFAAGRGIDFDPHNPTFPYADLATRATPLTVNPTPSNGGYLVDSENQQLLDIFRPYSPLLRAGVTVLGGLRSNAVFPSIVQDVSGQWLNSETATITEEEPVLGSLATSPKTFGVMVKWTNQLQRQAPDIESDMRGVCAKAAIEGVDLAAMTGTGATGVPLGLLNTSGIGTQAGAAFSWANAWSVRTALANANVDDDNIEWLGHPGTRNTLATRVSATGSSFIWTADDTLTGRDAQVSTIIPTGTLIAGDFRQIAYCFFGPGFQIDTTPFGSAADFQAGIMSLRLMVSVDVVLLHPTAFIAITNIS